MFKSLVGLFQNLNDSEIDDHGSFAQAHMQITHDNDLQPNPVMFSDNQWPKYIPAANAIQPVHYTHGKAS